MQYAIKIIETVYGYPSEFDGMWVKEYDAAYVHPEGYDGGLLTATSDVNQALRFDSPAQALEKWRETAPHPYHMRPDGLPNRPLTAFSVVIEPLPDLKT